MSTPTADDKGILERMFRLSEHGTRLTTELLAGLATSLNCRGWLHLWARVRGHFVTSLSEWLRRCRDRSTSW